MILEFTKFSDAYPERDRRILIAYNKEGYGPGGQVVSWSLDGCFRNLDMMYWAYFDFDPK